MAKTRRMARDLEKSSKPIINNKEKTNKKIRKNCVTAKKTQSKIHYPSIDELMKLCKPLTVRLERIKIPTLGKNQSIDVQSKCNQYIQLDFCLTIYSLEFDQFIFRVVSAIVSTIKTCGESRIR